MINYCHRWGVRFPLWPLGGAVTVIISVMETVIPIVATGGRCDHHGFHWGRCSSHYGHWGALCHCFHYGGCDSICGHWGAL